MEESAVVEHYRVPNFDSEITRILGEGPLSQEQLAAADQFHVMGLEGVDRVADALKLAPSGAFLDGGAGFGGPARVLAGKYDQNVTGLELNPQYVEVGNQLSERVGLADRARLVEGNVCRMPLANAAFDAAWTLHVGMNVPDKAAMYGEFARVLRPGGRFGVFDFVRGNGEPDYPLPWARDASTSHLVTATELDHLLEEAGLVLQTQEDLSREALAWLGAAQGQPPIPQLVSLVFRQDAKAIMMNLVRGLSEGRLQLILRVAVKPVDRGE